MKRLLTLVTLIALLGLSSFAQRTITGVVTSADDGSTLPGVSVRVKGTTQGVATDMEGKYSIQVAEGTATLVFSFVGMQTIELITENSTVYNVQMTAESVGVDEIIVTGVAGATTRKKLTITVAHLSEEEMKNVPASSAAGALQGKIAGVTVVNSSGNPGSAPTIRLRGATAIYGSQSPLIIVDGVMIEGTLADINVDDIANIEVVKGASASALYGSRAGNGVVVITTKSGKNLKSGQTRVTVRNEYGTSQLSHLMDIATHHQYKLADDWESESRYTKYYGTVTYGDLPTHTNPDSLGILVSGARVTDDDHYMDNPYGANHNHLEEFYQSGDYYTNYISVAHNTGKTNFMTSFENSKQQGIVFRVNGYQRNSFRLNVDHNFSDKLFLNASNLIVKSSTDNGNMDFFSLMQLQPDMDLQAKNPDGQDFRVKVDQFGTTVNPLYALANTMNNTDRFRVLGNYALTFVPAKWMRLEAKYSFERQNSKNHQQQKKDYLSLSTINTGGTGGFMYDNSGDQMAQVFQTTAMFNHEVNGLFLRGKLSYLYEDNHYEYFRTQSQDFSVNGIYTYDNMDQTKSSNFSEKFDIRAINAFGILDVDYKSKYLASALFRYDGASQFGSEERWAPYYRLSGAWRISQDVVIPGIQELKLRAAFGTAGNRPPYYAQYETWTLVGGSVAKENLGNANLKPSTIAELEIGLNVDFLQKFQFELVYSNTNAKDQHYPVPLAASAGGYRTQWQNMGTLNSKVIEATFGADLINTADFSWKLNITTDKTTQKITELNVAPFTYGARGNAGDPGSYYIEEGSVFGMIYGLRFVETLEEMAQQIATTDNIDNYTVNSDGYVILKGTEGTKYEAVTILKDENGVNKKVQIGDANPKFRMGIANTFNYKGIQLYTLLDWKQGGDIYNLTNQWMYRDYRAADMDQFGKPENEKKSTDYYQSLYSVANMNKHFVEDGTYLKIREISLFYNISESKLSGLFGGVLKGAKIGIMGRNLWTFTNYKGFDPEIGSGEGGGDATIQAWDEFAYPNFRTLSGSIELNF